MPYYPSNSGSQSSAPSPFGDDSDGLTHDQVTGPGQKSTYSYDNLNRTTIHRPSFQSTHMTNTNSGMTKFVRPETSSVQQTFYKAFSPPMTGDHSSNLPYNSRFMGSRRTEVNKSELFIPHVDGFQLGEPDPFWNKTSHALLKLTPKSSENLILSQSHRGENLSEPPNRTHNRYDFAQNPYPSTAASQPLSSTFPHQASNTSYQSSKVAPPSQPDSSTFHPILSNICYQSSSLPPRLRDLRTSTGKLPTGFLFTNSRTGGKLFRGGANVASIDAKLNPDWTFDSQREAKEASKRIKTFEHVYGYRFNENVYSHSEGGEGSVSNDERAFKETASDIYDKNMYRDYDNYDDIVPVHCTEYSQFKEYQISTMPASKSWFDLNDRKAKKAAESITGPYRSKSEIMQDATEIKRAEARYWSRQ
ncbi:uncharacterized protein IL334_003627 [Kwoniella shivajii]|uniref:Uncharacterized protein n=1 Tax=Kwoniella shivajii TaxID=564305 RepID=A0ABZ1CY41_9TREE|nr:hypothetical protein IL334_003627 [Kwoniella shivajii]